MSRKDGFRCRRWCKGMGLVMEKTEVGEGEWVKGMSYVGREVDQLHV